MAQTNAPSGCLVPTMTTSERALVAVMTVADVAGTKMRTNGEGGSDCDTITEPPFCN